MEDYSQLSSAFGALGTGAMSFALIVAVLSIVGLWKVFNKAGRKGWTAIIPIWNLITQLQVAGMSPWLVFVYLLVIIPIIGSIVVIIFSVFVNLNMAKAFGKGVGFTIGLVFLPFIFIPILGFGNSVYQQPKKDGNPE